jgi:hypothetical protein
MPLSGENRSRFPRHFFRLEVRIVHFLPGTERLKADLARGVGEAIDEGFDVPGNEVSQNEFYDEAPQVGTPPSKFYNALYGLTVGGRTIGSARQIQISLQLAF